MSMNLWPPTDITAVASMGCGWSIRSTSLCRNVAPTEHVFERHAEQVFPSSAGGRTRPSVPWVLQTPAVPTRLRDVLRVAERFPHRARVDPSAEGVRCGAPTELLEHDVPRDDRPVGVPEHLVDGSPELTHAHRTTLTTANAPAG
jgi:hypothetical protein